MRGNNILLRGYRDGERVKEKIEFNPTLFIPSNKKTSYRTLDGRFVEPIQPGSINDCRSFINKYKSVSGFEIYGNTDYTYQFIGNEYEGEVDYDFSRLNVAIIDIETTCEDGFPDINNPSEKIIAITVKMNGIKYVLGLGEFEITEEKTNCFQFSDEEELLISFVELWETLDPDVVTGWNIRFFDIPYMINRMNSIFGDDFSRKLSPWRTLKSREVTKMGRTQLVYEIVGVATLDYYELYQPFTYVNQESYKLDHICYVELGERKLSYEEYDTMSDFYKKDFQKFMEYNVVDVELVDKL